MIKLVLSIRALDIGGAEKQFIELVKHIDKSKFEVTVCTMYGGAQEEIVKNIPNIQYINLQKKGRYDFYTFYNHYSQVLKEINPDVIYSFLTEMNLFSLWAKPKKSKIIWGFRSSGKDWSQYGLVPKINFWLEKFFSSKVDKIISNSHASGLYHKKHGFTMNRATVIHNGIDFDKYKRDIHQREVFRNRYHLKENSIAIGIVARINSVKGYNIFSEVSKKILDTYDDIFFFSVGGGDEAIKSECEKTLKEHNNKKFIWLGNQNNVEECYSGFDMVVSSSLAEGFSNTIAEAMSCSLACVVTDVGDSALIVDDLGIVVEPRDVDGLYNGIIAMMAKDYNVLGQQSRVRVVENFSIQKMVSNTEKEIISCVE